VKLPSLFAAIGRVMDRERQKREADAKQGRRCGCGAMNHYPLIVGAPCRLCGAELPSITIQGGKAS
jgi:hypothetical protein